MDLIIFCRILLLALIALISGESITTLCNFDRFVGNIHAFLNKCNNHCTILQKFNRIQKFQLKFNDTIEKLKNVEALKFSYNNISVIPAGIDTNFPQLKALIFYGAGLTKITSSDFDQMQNLEFLNLIKNDIKVLEENLFKFNKKLTHIFMSKNKIKIINPTAFYGLSNLYTLNLTNNICCNHVAFNHSEVTKLLISVNDTCWNETSKISQSTSKPLAMDIPIHTAHQTTIKPNDDFREFYNRLQKGSAVEIITTVNSVILIILIILLILHCICKRKPQDKPKSFKPLTIDHTTHEESNSYNVNDYHDVPNVKLEAVIDEEELYSDIKTDDVNKEEQDGCLEVDEAVIYAEIKKINC